MTKTEKLLIVFFIIMILILCYIVINRDEEIVCESSLNVIKDEDNMALSVTQRMAKGHGIFIVSGTITENGKKSFVGKTIEFDYTQFEDVYKLISTNVQNSPQMKIPDDTLRKWLTGFTHNPGEKLSLKIKKINSGSWIIYSRTIPMYICER